MSDISGFYQDLASDPNNISYWLPKLQAKRKFDTFKMPKTAIVKVPPEIMELFFMEKKGMTQTEMMVKIMEWVQDDFVPQAEKEIGGGIWFIKNGTFSNKFEFNSCKNISSNILKLTANIIDINYQAFMFDAGGNTELVAREYIKPFTDNHGYNKIPSIYHGMPLRNEIRVFYDFDHQQVLYTANYWDWNYCYNSISRDATDKIVYEHYYPSIKERYKTLKEEIVPVADFGLHDVQGLDGIWSVDFMEEYPGGPLWLIDMAQGPCSAYWNPDTVKSIYQERGWIKKGE